MNRKIIVNHKEFKMEKMSADTYMEYLELAEQIDAATSESCLLYTSPSPRDTR
jgi:hypothetical protein